MDSRVNVEKYEAGCRKLRNFILHTHGPVFRRPGLEYMGRAGSDSQASRFISFNFSTTTRFVIEMAVGRFRFWSNGLLVQKVVEDQLVEVTATHPYEEDELFEVQVKQVNDVCYFAHRNHHPLKLVRRADDDWVSEDVPLRYPPLLDEYVEKESVATPTVTEVYDTVLEEAAEATFSKRTQGAVPGFTVDPSGGTTTVPVKWFSLAWTWPGGPLTGGITSGSKTVTLTSTTGRVVGEGVSGTGIPAGSYVTAVVDATHLTISATATVTNASALLTFNTGAAAKWLDVQVLRTRDNKWVTAQLYTLANLTAAPVAGEFQFRADGTTTLRMDRKESGTWTNNAASLASFFATATVAGAVPALQFRFVYRGATTSETTLAQANDLTGYSVTATDWEANTVNVPLTHVIQWTAGKVMTATWTLPAAVPGSRYMAWQVLDGANVWRSLYSQLLSPTLDDAPGVYRLRYVAETWLILEAKQANGTWVMLGGTVKTAAASASVSSWKLRWLYPDEVVQGISVAAVVAGCGTTSGSDVVTMPSTAGRSAGETVVGAGVPTGATVTGITNGTTLVISADATASATVSLTFTRDGRVTVTDGDVTHVALCERQESAGGLDFGRSGITLPKGKWQTHLSIPAEAVVPTGATVTLQRWTASGWTSKKVGNSPALPTWTLKAGTVNEYKGLSPGGGGELADATLVRFLYDGGTSGGRVEGAEALIETVTFPNAKATTLQVSDTIGQGRTMLAKDTSEPTPQDVSLFNEKHVGSYWQIAHRRDVSYTELSTTTSGTSSTIRVSGKWDIFTYGTWHGTLHLERKSSANIWQIVRSWTSKGDRNVTAAGTEEQDADLRLRMVHTVTGSNNPRFVLEASDSRTYGLVKVTGYVSPHEVVVDVVRVLAATTPTSLWAEGAWSQHRGFPAAVGLHEGRLWFGGSAHQPQTLWASVSNDFENFRRSTLDDGAMAVTLAAESSNSIRWLSSTTALLIGTGGEEWALRSAQDGAAITPTSIRVERQSGYSSMNLGALMAHEVTVFVQRDGRRIRQLSYTDAQQSYTAADLTVLAPHVTLGGVRQVAFQQAPTAILWVVTEDGKLAGMTFEREQNVFGWHVHETDGVIESVAVLHGTPADEVWVAVKRTIGGAVRRHVERMDLRAMASDWTVPGKLIYLDSAKAYDFDPQEEGDGEEANDEARARDGLVSGGGAERPLEAVVTAGLTLPQTAYVRMVTSDGVQMPSRWVLQTGTAVTDEELGFLCPLDFDAATNERIWVRQEGMTLTGLGHLAGRTVSVLADGAMAGSHVVSAAGEIELEHVALRLVVGLPFTSELQPMKQEVQMPDGTAQGRRFKLHGVTVRMDHSLGGEVHANPEDVTLPWSRMPGAIVLGNATPLYTGERDMILESRHEAAVNLTVRQQEPLPLNITALILKFDVYGD